MCTSTYHSKIVIELLRYFKDIHYTCDLFWNDLAELKDAENKHLFFSQNSPEC